MSLFRFVDVLSLSLGTSRNDVSRVVDKQYGNLFLRVVDAPSLSHDSCTEGSIPSFSQRTLENMGSHPS